MQRKRALREIAEQLLDDSARTAPAWLPDPATPAGMIALSALEGDLVDELDCAIDEAYSEWVARRDAGEKIIATLPALVMVDAPGVLNPGLLGLSQDGIEWRHQIDPLINPHRLDDQLHTYGPKR